MTVMRFQTANVAWAHARFAGLTAQGRGTVRLDQHVDRDYDRLSLPLPDPDLAADALSADYARYVGKHVDMETTDLLDQLSDEHGLMWLTIARVAQVSVPALRKWRQGGNPTLPKKAALARLLAACDKLREIGIPDVAAWLSTPVRLDQSRERVELLVLPDGGETLLALAQDKISPDQALDHLDPTWRDRTDQPSTEVTYDRHGVGTVHLADT